MPRITGVRQRLHQPLFDTMIRRRGNPATPITRTGSLFASNTGDESLTNIPNGGGQLASDQTYVILSMRVYLYFSGTNSTALYTGTSSQLWWDLWLGDRSQFAMWSWYHPAGGGIYGTDAATPVLNNGYPAGGAIFKLARPIILPVRQSIKAKWNFFQVPPGTGGAVADDVLPLINNGAVDDTKIVMYMVDGMQTRDVL